MKSKMSLADIVDVVVDNRGKSVPLSDLSNQYLPLIATKNVGASLYPELIDTRPVDKETYDSFFRAHPLPGDILFVNKGKPGTTARVPNPVDFVMAQDMVALRAKPGFDQDYVFALLRSPRTLRMIDNMQVGTMIPHFKKTDFDKLILDVETDLEVQKKIGRLYMTFSNAVEQKSRINDNLLDLSMTHFERWLETTSSTNNVSLDEIATYKNGLAMQKFEPENDADSLPVLKIRELNQGFTDSSSNRARTDIDKSVKVYDGDVIFSWSGTLLVDIWTGGPAGLNQHLFKVTSDAYPKWFYYMWTRYHLRQFQQIAAGKATTMGHIKRGDLKAADVIIPTDSEFVQLETLLKPVVDAYIENGVEIKSLQTIRDQLLQKLLG